MTFLLSHCRCVVSRFRPLKLHQVARFTTRVTPSKPYVPTFKKTGLHRTLRPANTFSSPSFPVGAGSFSTHLSRACSGESPDDLIEDQSIATEEELSQLETALLGIVNAKGGKDMVPPFNRLLGFKVETPITSFTTASISVKNKPELLGNPVSHVLHGGVTASLIDVTGGLVAWLSLFRQLGKKGEHTDRKAVKEAIARMATIDMRVDYLRKGSGDKFTCTGNILRFGRKVAVVSCDVHNDTGTLIAHGTTTYLVS